METDISLDDHPLGALRDSCFLFRLKRFSGTKHVVKLTWFHLKRFLGTKRLMKCAWYRLKRFYGTK